MLNDTSNSTHNDTGAGTHYHVDEHDSAVILFIFGSCAVGALTRRVIQGLNLRLPYTVVLLILGVMFGLLSGRFPEIHVYARMVDTDPHLLLSIFLPVLIFESAFAMEVHTFLKAFVQVILLAIPGLALASLLTCVLARYLFTYDWGWNVGMMFGCILSATDPVAVVALLRDIGASKQLAMVIEGESLLNDGAAIVFFKIFLKLTLSETGVSGGEIVLEFLQVAIGGPLFGFVMAKITLFWLSRIFNDALVEITITLTSTYLTYYIGEEFLEVSGVLAVVVLGVAMSAERTMISPEVERFLHRFWEMMAYLANTLIFIIVGMVISEKAIFEIHGIDWFYMFSLYFGLFVIRGAVIAVFSPILRHTGYGMTWKEGIVMTWGGLRGAVGLALALQVAHHDELDQERVGNRVLIHVSGIVFLTLFVNATTILGLLKVLGMSDLSPAKRMAMANALRFLQDMREKTLNMLKTDRFLADAEWETVENTTEINDPYKTTDEEAQVDESLDIKPHAVCPECDAHLPAQYSRKELRDMTNEAILRMLKAEKMSYWRQFEQGMLSREATRKLQECTEVAADKKGKFIDVEEIKKSWEIPTIYSKLKRFVKRLIIKLPVDIPKDSLAWPLFRITRHQAFYITIYVVIILDMINLAFSVTSLYVQDFHNKRDVFRSINVAFVGLYITEAALKIIVQKKVYFYNPWHILCTVIICIGIVDVVLSFVLPALLTEFHEGSHAVQILFILLRFIRLFRLLEPLMPYLLNFIKRRMSQHLSYGYDVGRGFVAGEEEVRKLIDHMVDHKDIGKTMKQMSDNARLDVIRCLGMLSKQHPDIALSIKTRQAIRSVLNQTRDGIHELLMDGILEEAETVKIERVVEMKMKRLINAAPTLPIPPPDKMLTNVFWLRNDPELVAYIKDKAKLINYNFDDVLMREGDPPGGIYIIVSGMVRLESSNPSGKPILSLQEKASGSQIQVKSYLLDFMTAGNIIGEMGLLTNKPRSATVICETAVQFLHISREDMDAAMKKFNITDDNEESLEYRLWHVCANRIAANILMKQATYQGWTKEKIKLRLENSYLANVDDDIFTVDSSMSDVVLVNGVAENPFTEEKFEGPAYIPWTVFKLRIIRGTGIPKPVVLVVPSEIGQPVHSHSKSTHEQQHGHGAFINSISHLCLKHASKHRTNIESKWKKVQQAKSLGTLFSQNKIDDETPQHPGRYVNGMTPGLHPGYPLGSTISTPGRMQGLQNEAFNSDTRHESSASDNSSSLTSIEEGSAGDISSHNRHSSKRARSSGWAKLKRAVSFDTKKKPEEVLPAPSSSFDGVVPATDDNDDFQYIEGDIITQTHHHDEPEQHMDQNWTLRKRTDSSSSETPHTFHTLDTVSEENEEATKRKIQDQSPKKKGQGQVETSTSVETVERPTVLESQKTEDKPIQSTTIQVRKESPESFEASTIKEQPQSGAKSPSHSQSDTHL